MIVVDSSALVLAFAQDNLPGERVRQRLTGERLVAPDHVDLEFVSALRKLVTTGALAAERAEHARQDFTLAPITRSRSCTLLDRIWELRHNVTPYDAAYVALAESLSAPLVTADKRLASAPGIRCRTNVIA